MLFLDIVLFALVGFLIWRVVQLYRHPTEEPPVLAHAGLTQPAEQVDGAITNSPAAREVHTYERVDWLSKAQIFAGIQMLDAKRKGLQLMHEHGDDCRLIAAIYFIGAARSITLDMSGSEKDSRDVAAFLITHNLHMDRLDIEHAQQSVTRDELTLMAYRCGLEGGSDWLKRHFVPDELSLFDAITNSAFV